MKDYTDTYWKDSDGQCFKVVGYLTDEVWGIQYSDNKNLDKPFSPDNCYIFVYPADLDENCWEQITNEEFNLNRIQ
jgi:hypothetical protein